MSMTKMRELTSKQSTPILVQSYNHLAAKQDRTEAEKLTLAVIGGQLSTRERARLQELPTDQVFELYRKNLAVNYKEASQLERNYIMVTSDVMEERYPEAAEVANTWLDGLTAEELSAQDGDSWDHKFLAAINELGK